MFFYTENTWFFQFKKVKHGFSKKYLLLLFFIFLKKFHVSQI